MLLIKIGGGKLVNLDYIAEDIAELIKKNPVVLVHGANVTRDEVSKQLGYETKTITSPSGVQSVYTDQQALDILTMVYAGLVNKRIVAKLQSYGINAVGLSGVDGNLWQAKWKKNLLAVENGKEKLITGSFTGRVEKINTDVITTLTDKGYTPVICPPAITSEHVIVNTDNDWASAIMAGSLGVKQMIVLFEAPGMLKDHTDENSLIPHISIHQLDDLMKYAKGRMQKKVLGAKKALELGVETIYWGDGRIEHPILNALEGKGTIINLS